MLFRRMYVLVQNPFDVNVVELGNIPHVASSARYVFSNCVSRQLARISSGRMH